jgi:ketosteroid isomerase-like protein
MAEPIPLLDTLDRLIAAVGEMRQAVAGGPARTQRPPVQDTGLSPRPGPMPPYERARPLFQAFLGNSTERARRIAELALRPVAGNATWGDMPTGASFPIAEAPALYDPKAWRQAFPDFTEEPINFIGNEDYLVIEQRARATHTGALGSGTNAIPATGRQLDLFFAEIIRIENGEIVNIDDYYDTGTVMRVIGLLPDVPMGHDEPTPAGPPALIHGRGFLEPNRDLRADAPWPIEVGHADVSLGSGKTRQAQQNAQGAFKVHDAFIQHKPEMFNDLIAPDGVWIDVPTGEVLSAGLAAAHHDHGNWQRAFPNSDAEITNVIANDSWGVVQHRGFGTHDGPLQLGKQVYPPTGRAMEIRVLDVVQYRDGKIVLVRNYYDIGSMLVQLGIVPGR